MKRTTTLTRLGSMIVIVIIAGCSHEHLHKHYDTPASIVRISEPEKFMPDVPLRTGYGGKYRVELCSAQVDIVFSSAPLNTAIVFTELSGYNQHGHKLQGLASSTKLKERSWWEQDRETVTIYFYFPTNFEIVSCTVSGVIQWQSGRKHFEITIDDEKHIR